MCLPNFKEFKRIPKNKSLIGFKSWRLNIKDPIELISESRDYKWNKIIEGPHQVKDVDSGIYAYNYNNNNYYNNNYNNNYYYNNYYIKGIIHQYGKTAIHKDGQRSQYAKIITLFTIRESDAAGPDKFIDWIKEFNQVINQLTLKYKANTIHFQDYK